MLDTILIPFSTATMILIVGWLSRAWIEKRLAASLKLETEKVLEEFKAKYAKQIALTDARVAAYKDLWEKTADLNPRGNLQLDASAVTEKFSNLRSWYYEEGNAMHLSASTTNDFLKGLDYLEQAPSEESLALIKSIFSSVRTHIKEDLGVYDRSDLSVKLPDYNVPLVDGTSLSEPSRNT